MSAPLVVSIPHRLGREEATRRLKTGLTRAASSVPVLKSTVLKLIGYGCTAKAGEAEKSSRPAATPRIRVARRSTARS